LSPLDAAASLAPHQRAAGGVPMASIGASRVSDDNHGRPGLTSVNRRPALPGTLQPGLEPDTFQQRRRGILCAVELNGDNMVWQQSYNAFSSSVAGACAHPFTSMVLR
jgi:hypothetical protein